MSFWHLIPLLIGAITSTISMLLVAKVVLWNIERGRKTIGLKKIRRWKLIKNYIYTGVFMLNFGIFFTMVALQPVTWNEQHATLGDDTVPDVEVIQEWNTHIEEHEEEALEGAMLVEKERQKEAEADGAAQYEKFIKENSK